MKIFTLCIALTAISLLAIGCDKPTTIQNGSPDVQSPDDDHEGHDHAAHAHSPKHGGHLIELGRNHEYHAELLDDHKTESVTVWLMDSHMEPLTVDEATISLVMTVGDDTQSFDLKGTQPGGSDEFSSDDAKLMEMIEAEEATGKLRVQIEGTPFSGSFDHHGHDHEGHDHEGHDHEDHDHEGHDH